MKTAFSEIISSLKMNMSPGEDRELPDYDTYAMSAGEKLLYMAAAVPVIYFIGYIFYHSHLIAAVICPLAFFFPRIRMKEIIKKRKNELNLQFRDMLFSLSSSLSAGKSMELAFKDILKDLSILYPDPGTSIIRETACIIRKIEMNETIESALADFAKRAHLDDIDNFVDVFCTCKRTGGNFVEVIRNTSNIINDKIEIRQEMEVMLAERKFEQKILNMLPVFMVVLLSASARDYMEPVFTTVPGRAAMTVSVALLAAAYFISRKIMDIKV